MPSPFLFYVPMMLATLLWNAFACLAVFRRRRNWPRILRRTYYLGLVLSIPALICAGAGMSPERAYLLNFAWLYPVSFLLAAYSGFGCLRREQFPRWMLAVPLFNLLLALVSLTRYLAYLGLPVGVLFNGLHVSYAMTQSLVAFFLYIFFPILDWCPVLLLPVSPSGKRVHRLNLLPVVPCALYVGLNLILLPFGCEIAASWRRPLPDVPTGVRKGFRAGVVLRINADSPLSEEVLDRELTRIEDLGLRAVNLFVHNDLMTDNEKTATLTRFLDELRRRDIAVILTAEYPNQWFRSPPADSDQVLQEMLPFQRFLAARFRPDYLVPFIEPYGAFVAITRNKYPPTEWARLLDESAAAIHRESPGVRCAVYFGQEENDGLLYALVCGPASKVDAVGFSFYALYKTREQMGEQLARVSEWIKQSGGNREHWVFEFGQSPLTMGGERAQSHYIQWVTRWAARQPRFAGACVFALGDYVEKMGLINSRGRKRPAYHAYRRLAVALNARSEPDS
ncbi:MAG: hypothetical protein GXP31_19540 [Kiritimatiellaeota bacterium]|nr:hypothetical protein [Kiritimatiellota bacterium]